MARILVSLRDVDRPEGQSAPADLAGSATVPEVVLCAACGEPLTTRKVGTVPGKGVGLPGRVHKRCHDRVYKRLLRAEGRKPPKPTPPPAPVRRNPGPRPKCLPQPEAHRRRASDLLAEGRTRLDALAPAEACRVILRQTRGVFRRATTTTRAGAS